MHILCILTKPQNMKVWEELLSDVTLDFHFNRRLACHTCILPFIVANYCFLSIILYICINFTIVFNIFYFLYKYNLLSKHLIVFSKLLFYLYQKILIFSFECNFCLREFALKTVFNHYLDCFKVECINTRTPPRKY